MEINTAKRYAVRSLDCVRHLSLFIPCMISQVPAMFFTSIHETAVASTTATIITMASLLLSQAVLQVADSWFGVLGQTLSVAGVTEENMLRRKLMMIHTLAKNIRMMGREEKRKEVENKLQNISLFGLALVMVMSVRFIKQIVVLMIINMKGTFQKLKYWILTNKKELALAILLTMNTILLWTKILSDLN